MKPRVFAGMRTANFRSPRRSSITPELYISRVSSTISHYQALETLGEGGMGKAK